MRRRTYPPHKLEEFLAGRAEQVVAARLLKCEVDNGFQHIVLNEMLEYVAVVQFEACAEEAESS